MSQNKQLLILAPTNQKTSGWGRLTNEIIHALSAYWDISALFSQTQNPELVFSRNPVSFLKNCMKVCALARKADVILCLEFWPYGLYAYIASILFKKPYVLVGVGTYSVSPFEKKGIKHVIRYIARKAFCILSISNYTKQEIQKRAHPDTRNEVVSLGLSRLPALLDVQVQAQRLHYAHISKYSPILLSVGEVKDRKGQLDTVMAMPQILKTFPNAAYVIVGGDKGSKGYVGKIQKVAEENGMKDRVIFVTDADTDEELAYLYSQADVFDLASNNQGTHFEGLGLVILEANSFGVPAVGTKGCGIEDVIKDGETGILIPQRDSDAIARAVASILTHGKLSYDQDCKQWASTFSWTRTASKYTQILQEALVKQRK